MDLPLTSGNHTPTRYKIAWGRPTDEYREKKIHPVVSLDYTSIFGKQYDGIGTTFLFFIFYFYFFIFST
jgi:hypothetical protein